MTTNTPVAREVAENPWSTITYFEDSKTLELKWLPASKDMSDEQVKETLQLFIDACASVRAPYLLVDIMQFGRGFTDEINAWRDVHIIPAYNASGTQKMAFLAPEQAPVVERGFEPANEPGASFPTGWFSNRDNLNKWLASGPRRGLSVRSPEIQSRETCVRPRPLSPSPETTLPPSSRPPWSDPKPA